MICARCKKPSLRKKQCGRCLRVLCGPCSLVINRVGNVRDYRVICRVDCKGEEKS